MTNSGPLSLLPHRRYFLAVLGVALCLSAPAQEAAAQASKADAAREALVPLGGGLPKAPVDLFRRLLVMSPPERDTFLAKRSPETQKLILAKLREYSALKPEQRDLRLRVTELRWYLLPLLNAPQTNRATQLDSIPPLVRGLVEDRLGQWDRLPPAAQKRILENESFVSLYLDETDARATPAAAVSDAARPQFEAGIRRWQALTEEQRQETMTHFNEFFRLTPSEQEKTLRTLSEGERVQIEKSLHTFEGLTPSQRSQCLRSFQKFANFSPEERRQFLKDAERWELMSPSERQSWRNLVYSVSRLPPVPPGLGMPGVPRPPISRLYPDKAPVATNSN